MGLVVALPLALFSLKLADTASAIAYVLTVGYVGGTMRRRFRAKYGLPEEPCSDYFVYALCERCAIAEEAREWRKRVTTYTLA